MKWFIDQIRSPQGSDSVGNQLIWDLTKEIDHPRLEEKQRVYASIDACPPSVKFGRVFCENSRVENGAKGECEI